MLKLQKRFVDNQKYRKLYNQNCQAWRFQPTQNRQLNDVFCIVLFFAITFLFISVGLYYIITVDSNEYNKKTKAQSFIQQIIQYKWSILISFMSTTFLNILYIYLLNVAPKCIIYTLIIGTIIIFPAFNLTENIQMQWWKMLTVEAVFCLIYLIVVGCYRKQINIGIVLINIATRFMIQNKIVFIAILIKISLISVFGLFWYISKAMIQIQIENYQILGQDTSTQKAFLLLWDVLFIYYQLLIYYLMVFTISTIFALWYYQIKEPHPLRLGWKWIIKSSFGSLSFAASIITLTKFICILFDTQKQHKCNCVAKYCIKLLDCCFSQASGLINFLNHNSIILMAVSGQNFINSSKSAIGIIGQQFAVISMFQKFIIFWGLFFSILTPLIIRYFILNDNSLNNVRFLSFLNGNTSVLLLFMLSQGLSCVIMFYCIDKRFKQLGYTCHRMPKQIQIALQLQNNQLQGQQIIKKQTITNQYIKLDT